MSGRSWAARPGQVGLGRPIWAYAGGTQEALALQLSDAPWTLPACAGPTAATGQLVTQGITWSHNQDL